MNNVEHIEATNYTTFGITKIFFHPNVDINMANAQVTAIAQTLLRQMPSGTQPPVILNYNASSVPVLQLALAGEGLTEQQLADLAMIGLRSRLVTVQGAAIPWPFGGKSRQIQIDLLPDQLAAHNLTGQDVANALARQNVIIPAGNLKIHEYEYSILVNNTPSDIDEIGDLPVARRGDATLFIRDVAHVHDGSAVQTNIVHVDGGRSVLMSIYKIGEASTLDVIDGIYQALDASREQLPDALEVKPIGDQSGFVRNAVQAVVLEGVIAAGLTSLLILLFLGSWRPTLIVATSIPLSVLGAITGLSFLGQTLNIMTLGGLALAVGILVDEATVTIESISTQIEDGEPLHRAIYEGSKRVTVPAFVSMLCICIVFVPMFFLEGIAGFLFVPMALAVMLAMAFSFLLSRTLVPVMALYLIRERPQGASLSAAEGTSSSLSQNASLDSTPDDEQATHHDTPRWHQAFDRGFNRFRDRYVNALSGLMIRRRALLIITPLLVAASFTLVPWLGENFFPDVDGGQIKMHVRAPVGTRVEDTAAIFADIQDVIREVIPADEMEALVDNVGTYISSMNTIYSNTGTIGPQDGDIMISLVSGHAPTADYVKRLREVLPQRFPGVTFSFLPADMVSQILNAGAPSPIDIQIRGQNVEENMAWARRILPDLKQIPGLVDARIQQTDRAPAYKVTVDRTRALASGTTQQDVTNNMVVTLAGSAQVASTYWLNPANGANYPVVMQTPQYRVDSLDALSTLPVQSASAESPLLLGSVAEMERTQTSGVVSSYNMQPLIQIYATRQGRDMGAVARDIQQVLDAHQADRPKGSSLVLTGHVATMMETYQGLISGLAGAMVLIYLLIVVNFHSWVDPLAILLALPVALAGIVWALFITGTSLSVPALTGAIMCMGVSTANSVLVISYARDRLSELLSDSRVIAQAATHNPALIAAMDAGRARLRPVMMTALAMMIGMLPMAIGHGEGGEQNAPLARAVIGGLFFATFATLFLVPVLFSLFHRRDHERTANAVSGAPAHATTPSSYS